MMIPSTVKASPILNNSMSPTTSCFESILII
jgi:hypothetical protein